MGDVSWKGEGEGPRELGAPSPPRSLVLNPLSLHSVSLLFSVAAVTVAILVFASWSVSGPGVSGGLPLAGKAPAPPSPSAPVVDPKGAAAGAADLGVKGGAEASDFASTGKKHDDSPLPATADAAASAACALPAEGSPYPGRILNPGAANPKPSAVACRDSCRGTPGCNSWAWCFGEDACVGPDGAEFPRLGCLLAAEPRAPWGRPSKELEASYKPSTYISGYVKLRAPGQLTFVRLHSAPTPRVVIAMELPHRSSGCPAKGGDVINLLSLLNKKDYARWHSYDVAVATETLQPDLHNVGGAPGGPINMLPFLARLLDETPAAEAEWILYMAPDLTIDDLTFTFPFESFAGKDLILVGDKAKVQSGDVLGVDLGSVLLRNSAWSKKLVAKLIETAAATPAPPPEKAYKTNPVSQAIIDSIAADPALLDRVRFETDFCMACDWRRINLAAAGQVFDKTKAWGDANKNWKLFTTRFFDCQTCWGGGGMDGELAKKCSDAAWEHYEFAYCRFHRNVLAADAAAARGPPLHHLSAADLPVPEGMKKRGMAPPPLYDFKGAERAGGKVANPIVVAAKGHVTPTGQACYEACVANPKCVFWVWCAKDVVGGRGCDDAGEWSGRFPAGGCELAALTPGLKPTQWDRGPAFSTFESGYITPAHPLANRAAGLPTGAAASSTRIAVLTGIAGTPCSTPWGDYFLELALKNKADWARLHGYELHQMAQTLDATIRPGAWQKVALLQRALRTIPPSRAEWLLWLDMDVVIGDVATTFPVDWYTGKDLVMWGFKEKISGGDVHGMNSGVLLLRNSAWTRSLIDAIAEYGRYPVDLKVEEKLAAALPSYDVGMYEQNVLTYLFKTDPAKWLPKVRFEDALSMNVWYKKVYEPDVEQPAFIVHFAGCQVCNGFHPEKLGVCDAEYVRNYAESVVRLERAVKAKGGMKK